MKGCLGKIVNIVIAVLVFYGLVHIGAIDFVKEKIDQKIHPSQEELIDKTKDFVDLSEVDKDEYKIEKNLKFLKNRMIVAEHNATNQQMILIEPRNEDILTQEDIKNDDIQQKLENAITKYKYQPVKFNKIEVQKHGEMNGFSQKIPYVKIYTEISNLPIKDREGIIGVAKSKDGKNIIVISVNAKGKYSQIITNAFYEKLNYAE